MFQCSVTESSSGRRAASTRLPDTETFATRTSVAEAASCSPSHVRGNDPVLVPALDLAHPNDWLGRLNVPALHTLELATVWERLCSRKVRNVASFFTEQECGAVLESCPNGGAFGRPIDAQDIDILQRMLIGHNQKVVALECGRSASMISTTLRRTLRTFGFDCTGSKLPLFVVMAAYAARVRSSHAQHARATTVRLDGRVCEVILVQRPDREFTNVLSQAEYAVTRLVVEGLSHARIASVRGTSRRTVANQLATSFRKLHVSGRIHMLATLVVNGRRASAH